MTLWINFLAVMTPKRPKDAGTLTFWGKCFGYPVLFAGLLLELISNLLR